MTEQVMIYVISGSANENSKELFSSDNISYFYWNDLFFRNLNVGDYVFVVNKNSGYVLFTSLDKKGITTKIDQQQNKTFFNDEGKSFVVNGTQSRNKPWDNFIRLKIINKLNTPSDWVWQSLGNAENTYLNGNRTSSDSAENRIKNIEQLKRLTEDETVSRILENCLQNFNGGTAQQSPIKPFQKTKQPTQSEMNILTAIKTKPFILLAGISGTGKSRLVRTMAYQTCSKEGLRKDSKKPGNFELIPVRPNWHDSSELMGYVSRINGEKYITTSFLQFIAKAWKYIDVPFFLCLDEMNLAPVEQYFAEYLSIIETRRVHGNEVVTDFLISKASFENPELYTQILKDLGLGDNETFSNGIGIPKNLVVIGTVNMDETTHSFSRKVLDRAMTFEMNHVDLNNGLDKTKIDWSYPQEYISQNEVIGDFTSGAEVVTEFASSNEVIVFLQKINTALDGTPFKIAYRVRDEFLIYCYYASLNPTDSNWLTNALDEMTSMKILSRIEGDETKIGDALSNLQRVLTGDFKKSNAKLKEMETRLQTSGYTSFWS